MPQDKAGTRLTSLRQITDALAADGSIGRVAASIIGPDAKPVRAIYFDKSESTNWALDWHQDRVICVSKKHDAAGYGPWTVKSGLLHVAPPFDLLASMVTLRVHLDNVRADNAPLLIAPGSHLLGSVSEASIKRAVAKCGTFECLAQAGDVWLYSTPILHASKRADTPRRRRVLQLDYAAFTLPFGLEWQPLI